MSGELELIGDGEGLAVIGSAAEVDKFFRSAGITGTALPIDKLDSMLRTGSSAAMTGAEIMKSSGRWVKLTKESAALMKKSSLMRDSATGEAIATLITKDSKRVVKHLRLEDVGKSVGKAATNPALLTGAAGLMAQLAMEQSMAEITDYLKTIDKKVDDVIRSQKNAVLADMVGVQLAIEEAMTIREQVGSVSEITWSKVQANSTSIARTQAYALSEINVIQEKIAAEKSVDELAKLMKAAQSDVVGWLAVLARCFQLQDALSIIELERVLKSTPEELENHRLGIHAARQKRVESAGGVTTALLNQLSGVAEHANAEILMKPMNAPAVVKATNEVAQSVLQFERILEIQNEFNSVDAKRWSEAADEVKNKAIEKGTIGVEAAKRISGEAAQKGKNLKAKTRISLKRNKPSEK